jgi:hypothetical protein
MGYNARNDEIHDNIVRMQREWEAYAYALVERITKGVWCFLILLAAFELPSAPLTRSPRRRACRSRMRECRDKGKNGRDRREETVNAEGVNEGDLQIHEIDREAHAYFAEPRRSGPPPSSEKSFGKFGAFL